MDWKSLAMAGAGGATFYLLSRFLLWLFGVQRRPRKGGQL
jgi:hypothetical protein